MKTDGIKNAGRIETILASKPLPPDEYMRALSLDDDQWSALFGYRVHVVDVSPHKISYIRDVDLFFYIRHVANTLFKWLVNLVGWLKNAR